MDKERKKERIKKEEGKKLIRLSFSRINLKTPKLQMN